MPDWHRAQAASGKSSRGLMAYRFQLQLNLRPCLEQPSGPGLKARALWLRALLVSGQVSGRRHQLQKKPCAVRKISQRQEIVRLNTSTKKTRNWGARIRTSECLNQNQEPYHLATPQRMSHSKSLLTNSSGVNATIRRISRIKLTQTQAN